MQEASATLNLRNCKLSILPSRYARKKRFRPRPPPLPIAVPEPAPAPRRRCAPPDTAAECVADAAQFRPRVGADSAAALRAVAAAARRHRFPPPSPRRHRTWRWPGRALPRAGAGVEQRRSP